MNKLLSKSKQTIFAFLSNVTYTFAIWFIAVLINHFYGAETLGEYSFIQAIIAPLALFFHLQLKTLATLELRIKEKSPEYISVFLLSESFFFVIILIIAFVLKQKVLFYAFALFKIFESLNWLIQGYYQSRNDFYRAFLIALSRSTVVLLVFFILPSRNLPLYLSFSTIGLVWFLIFFFFDSKRMKKEDFQISFISKFNKLKPLLYSGASLSIITSLDSFMVAIPRYFIKGYYDDIELGKFTMVLQFFIASTIFVVSVGHPFLVKLKNHIDIKDFAAYKADVRKTSIIFLVFSVLTIIFFLLAGKFVMKLFWGEEYIYLSKYLSLSMLGTVPLFLSSVFIFAINSLRLFSIHIKYYPIIVLSSFLFGIILIPKYGIAGAVYTLIFTQFIRMILSGTTLFYLIRKKPEAFE